MSDIDALEHALDYQFNQHALLVQALSHRSIGSPNNERLEYLGDSILGFFIAESLYCIFPLADEGDLTTMRARLVRRSTLASLARQLRLDTYMVMGDGELKNRGCNRDSVLSGAFEAIVGAVYLDGGSKSVNQLLEKIYRIPLAEIHPQNLKDSKTRLQEALQKDNCLLPVYRIIKQDGEAHNLTFRVSCFVPGIKKEFIASGKSRKSAEQAAAQCALNALIEHD